MTAAAAPPGAPAPPLLLLLGHLTQRLLAARGGRGPVRLAGVELERERIHLLFAVEGLTRLLDGPHRVTLTLRDTAPERSVFRVSGPDDRPAGRLLGLGARWLPRRALNRVLAAWLGPALRVEGDDLIVFHAALLRTLGV